MPDKNAPASGFQYSVANLKPVEPEPRIALTFPDGAKREFPKSITLGLLATAVGHDLCDFQTARVVDVGHGNSLMEGREMPF